MSADAIVGLGELIASDSPGETFYRGAAWKEVLRRQVRLHLAALGMGAADSTQLQSLETQLAELDGENQQLRQRAEQERAEALRLQQAMDRMQVELIDMQRQLEARPTVVEGGLRLNVLVDRLPRDARRYVPREPSDVEMLVIHHTAAPPETSLQDIATAHRGRLARHHL